MVALPAFTTVRANDEFQFARAGKLFVVQWLKDPKPEAFDRIKEEVLKAARETPDLIYVGVSGDVAFPAGVEEQRRLVKNVQTMFQVCSEVHLVLLGTSLKATVTRTVVRGMVFAARMGQRVVGIDVGSLIHKVTVHDALGACIERVAPRLGVSIASLEEQFSRAGIK